MNHTLSLTSPGWLWLRLAVASIYLALIPVVPGWVVCVVVLVLWWQWLFSMGRRSLPGGIQKILMVSVGFIATYFSYGRMLGLEPMATILLLAVLFKLLEIRVRRDLLLVLFLCLLLIASQWLFNQTVWAALYGLVCLCLVLTSLLAFHRSALIPARSPLRLTLILLLQSLPLMVAMFVVIPRLGAFWSVPAPHSAKTGVSDKLSPGDFNQLSRSAEVAFRVTFEAAPPSMENLYWRGMTLSEFDGRQWRKGNLLPAASAIDIESSPLAIAGGALRYEVIQQPTQQQWLFSLPYAQLDKRQAIEGGDLTWFQYDTINKVQRYRVKSFLHYQFYPRALPDFHSRINTRLPADSNPRAQAWAHSLFDDSATTSAYIRAVLGSFRENLTYRLDPPLLGKDSIDEFLFSSKTGYCEHFASAFVFLMRAVGIPARVVVGYQGGEQNGEYWIVRQYDAHAWAEVWLADQGWTRIDPTALVAPARIQEGMSQLNPSREITSLAYYRRFSLINQLTLHVDRLNYLWQQTVLNFDEERQFLLLKRLLGEVTPLRIALFLLVAGGGVLLILAIMLLWQRSGYHSDPVKACYRRLQKKLAKRGCCVQTGETPRQFCKRAAIAEPEKASQLLLIGALFESVYYAEDPDDVSKLNSAVLSLSF